METKYVKPRAGLVVRDPITTEPLPAEGKDVTLTTYWRRRLRDGDAVEAPRPKAAKAAATKES